MAQLARGRTRSNASVLPMIHNRACSHKPSHCRTADAHEVTKATPSTAPTTPTTLNSRGEPDLQISPTSSKTSLGTIEHHNLAFLSTTASVPAKFTTMPAKQPSQSPPPISKSITALDVSQTADVASRSGRARKPTEKAQQLADSGSKYYASLKPNNSKSRPKDRKSREVINEDEAELVGVRRKSTSVPISLQESGASEESASSTHSEDKKVSAQAEKSSVVEPDTEAITTSVHGSPSGPRKRKGAGRVPVDNPHSAKRTRGTAAAAFNTISTGSPTPDSPATKRVSTELPPSDRPSTQKFSKAIKESIHEGGSTIDDTTFPVRATRMKTELPGRPIQSDKFLSATNSQPRIRRSTRRSAKGADYTNIDIEEVPAPAQKPVQKSNSAKSTRTDAQQADRTTESNSSKAQQVEGLRQIQNRCLEPADGQTVIGKGGLTNYEYELSRKHVNLDDTEPPRCQLKCLDVNETLLAFAEIAKDIPDFLVHVNSEASPTEDEQLQQELNSRMKLYCKCEERDEEAGATDSGPSALKLSGLVRRNQKRTPSAKPIGQQEVALPKTAATNLKIREAEETRNSDISSQNSTPLDTRESSVANQKAPLKLKLNAPKQARQVVRLKVPRIAVMESDDDK